MKELNIKIYKDICHEIARLRYDNNNLAERLAKRVKRKYSQRIEREVIEKIILKINLIYEFVKRILPRFIVPSASGYASFKEIKLDELNAKVLSKYPKESRAIISDIVGWVVYWNYLR